MENVGHAADKHPLAFAGHPMRVHLFGKVRIDLEIIKNDRSGISGRTEFIHTDVVELMSYIHQKILTNT